MGRFTANLNLPKFTFLYSFESLLEDCNEEFADMLSDAGVVDVYLNYKIISYDKGRPADATNPAEGMEFEYTLDGEVIEWIRLVRNKLLARCFARERLCGEAVTPHPPNGTRILTHNSEGHCCFTNEFEEAVRRYDLVSAHLSGFLAELADAITNLELDENSFLESAARNALETWGGSGD